MSDLISRSALKMAFEEDGHLSAYIEEYINDAPAVDAVPVVRCRECKRRDTDVCARNAVYCTEFGEFMPYNGFCHKGAKMDRKGE